MLFSIPNLDTDIDLAQGVVGMVLSLFRGELHATTLCLATAFIFMHR